MLGVKDKTYCMNPKCPFEDCDRHPHHTVAPGIYSYAPLDGTCRRYIRYLVKEVYRDKQRRTYLY